MADASGITVNERLFEAGLLDAHDAAVRSGDLDAINMILSAVDLRQDEEGMNWHINA